MILISACLANVPCRYDGGTNANPLVQQLIKDGKGILVCPEQLGGLTTPRPPAEIVDGKVFTKEGTEVSLQFQKGAAIVLRIAQEYGCTKAILKARSPSCGANFIYDGTFTKTLVQGDGITAALLIEHGIQIYNETELDQFDN